MRIPPRRWLFPVALAVLVTGLSALTFFSAEGGSYLSEHAEACANCHIMRGHYDAWSRSSHKAAATCNGCHVPEGFLGHYAAKGLNGFLHSWAFTTEFFEEPIRIRPVNREIVLDNCRRCHGGLVDRMSFDPQGREIDCLTCHRHAGH